VQALRSKNNSPALHEVSEKISSRTGKANRLSAALERSLDVLIAFADRLVLWVGTQLVIEGEISGGSHYLFIAYLKSAYARAGLRKIRGPPRQRPPPAGETRD